MITIYAAVIETRHGTSVFYDATEAGLTSQVWHYVKSCWDELADTYYGEMPDDPDDAIKVYFEEHPDFESLEHFWMEFVEDEIPAVVKWKQAFEEARARWAVENERAEAAEAEAVQLRQQLQNLNP